MDITQLRDLPLTVLIILGAYWVIQRHNDEYNQKLIALIGEFTVKYQSLVERATEEREDARQRWMERDRTLVALIIDVKDSANRSQTEFRDTLSEYNKQLHALRNMIQPFVTRMELEQRRSRKDEGNDATS